MFHFDIGSFSSLLPAPRKDYAHTSALIFVYSLFSPFPQHLPSLLFGGRFWGFPFALVSSLTLTFLRSLPSLNLLLLLAFPHPFVSSPLISLLRTPLISLFFHSLPGIKALLQPPPPPREFGSPIPKTLCSKYSRLCHSLSRSLAAHNFKAVAFLFSAVLYKAITLIVNACTLEY